MNKIILIFLILLSQLPISEGAYNQIEAKFKDNLVPKDIVEKKETEKKEENLLEFTIYPLPQKNTEKNITLGARAYEAIDLETNEIIQAKNEDEKLPIASLTKVMTAVVVLKNTDNLEKTVTVQRLNNNPYEATMELIPSEKIKVKELLHGLLIKSAGDAASTLAVALYGSEEKFIFEMNVQAGILGMKNTHFSNPIGLDEKDNYSTASDILTLTRFALSNKTFREIIQKKEYTAKAETKQTHYLQNTNIILDNLLVFGVKTGRTLAAGECLISLSRKNEHEILTVVLNSPNRFSESSYFINWIYKNFSW